MYTGSTLSEHRQAATSSVVIGLLPTDSAQVAAADVNSKPKSVSESMPEPAVATRDGKVPGEL